MAAGLTPGRLISACFDETLSAPGWAIATGKPRWGTGPGDHARRCDAKSQPDFRPGAVHVRPHPPPCQPRGHGPGPAMAARSDAVIARNDRARGGALHPYHFRAVEAFAPTHAAAAGLGTGAADPRPCDFLPAAATHRRHPRRERDVRRSGQL